MSAAADWTLTLLREGLLEALEYEGLELCLSLPDGTVLRRSVELAPLVLGAGPDCDVGVVVPGVSRRHCELRRTEAGLLLRDLDSKNGTWVESVRVREAYLSEGRVAHLGQARFTVRPTGGKVRVPLSSAPRFGEALGLSVPMRALFALLERVAPTHESVLLLGESGTGKELLARALHERSARAQGPFVVVDCAALSPQLVEAELFGHVKGAFTGALTARTGLLAQAHGGTLFLDEIGELPPELQPKLLRALESREVRAVGAPGYRPIDIRVVAATHRDLRQQVAAGRFREDLYFRLAVVEARVPPLRERPEDIPLLVEDFLRRGTEPNEDDVPAPSHTLPAPTLALWQAHRWPGNVRELRNAVSRFRLFPDGRFSLLPFAQDGKGAQGPSGSKPWLGLPLREARALVVADFERDYVTQQLRLHHTIPAAAKAMGVSRQFAHRLVKEYGLPVGPDAVSEMGSSEDG